MPTNPIIAVRRWFQGGYNERAVEIQPAPKDHQQLRGFLLPLAARGPDWGVGEAGNTTWHPSSLRVAQMRIDPGNYGLVGSKGVGKLREDPSGHRNPYYGRVRSVSWDHDKTGKQPYPTFIPMLPAWNNMPKGALYNLRVGSPNLSANYRTSRTPVNIGKPLQFDQARTAKLMKGVN